MHPRRLAERAVPAAPGRMSRAAAFVFGASIVVTACGAEVTSGEAAGPPAVSPAQMIIFVPSTTAV